MRRRLSHVRATKVRRVIAFSIAALIYKPMVGLGRALGPVGLSRAVPLFEAYRGKSFRRVEQDAYDRFFTSIEQRVSRAAIMQQLSTTFGSVRVSEQPPYWHFLCER